MNHGRIIAGGAAIAVALGLAIGAPASAEDLPGVSRTETAPMYVTGYDEATAAAHGFRIEVDSDGTPRSIPVTAEARAIMDAAKISGSTMEPFNTVPGNCGTSSLFISKNGSTKINVMTAYSVYIASVQHTWNVDGYVTSGTWSEPFSGLNFSTTWAATHVVSVRDNYEGYGKVRAGSSALLINGFVCTSNQPTDDW